MLQLGQQILAAQPLSALLGAELTQFAEGRAELRLAITDRLKQQNGFVHGGVICYAADTALTFAGGSALGTAVVTSDLLIHYLRPGIGDWLVARASVVGTTRTRAVCRCDVFVSSEQGERLCATAQGSVTFLGQPRAGSSPNPPA
jgi:uncharacterized protein (TIGR00369 family)